MKTHILSVLLLTAAFPLAAAAQNTTTSPGGTPSTQQDTTTPGATNPSATPAAPTDGGNSTMDSGSTTNDGSTMNSGSAASSTPGTSASMSGETFVTVPETGAWRVSDLQGKAVYGSDGANIGEINDVLVSQDGSVNAVIIGVGGFLGIGEKDVAVNMSALQLGPGDTQAQANAASSALPDATGATGATGTDTTGTAGMGASGTAGTGAAAPVTGMDGSGATTDQSTNMAANNNGAKIGDDGLPDRIILNVTRDELEKAPAFEGVRGPNSK